MVDDVPDSLVEADVEERIDEAVEVAKIGHNCEYICLELSIVARPVVPVHEDDHVRPPAEEEGQGYAADDDGHSPLTPKQKR